MNRDFGPNWPRLYSEAAAQKQRNVAVTHRPFDAFGRAEQRPDFLRQMPADWKLSEADKARSERWDKFNALLCCVGFALAVCWSIYMHVTIDMPQPAVAVTANK